MDRLTVTPGRNDSIEKLVHKLALFSPGQVTWGKKDKILVKEPLERIVIAPSMWRTFICTVGCSACCWVDITLDYMPHEAQLIEIPGPERFEPREVIVNGSKYTVMTFDRRKQPGKCPMMSDTIREGGPGCSLWPNPPLECQAAPQLQVLQARPNQTYLMKKPFSRAWRFKITPECQFVPADDLSSMGIAGDLALLERYVLWAKYLEIETVLPSIVNFFKRVLETGLIPEGAYVVWDHGVTRT